MLRMLAILLGVVALAVGAVSLSGFEAGPPPRPDHLPPDRAEAPAFKLVVLEDCITLNPQGTSSLTDFRIINCLFEGLLRTDATDLSLQPGAAESLPTVSDDGRVYTYTIRDDARWSNGDPVTAHDFVFAWRRAITYDFAAVYSNIFYVIEGAEELYEFRKKQLEAFDPAVTSAEEAWDELLQRFDDTVGIEAPDDRTLVVTLDSPTAYFPALTAFGTLMPNHRATVEPCITLDPVTGRANFDGTYFTDADRMVSNGAFVLTDWELRRRMVLDANPHYWDQPRVKSPRLIQTVIQDNDPLRVVRYLDGEFHWVPSLSAELAIRLMEAGHDELVPVPRAGTYYYALNVRPDVEGKPNPLADRRVRRALAMTVDKQALVDRVTRLGQPVASTFVPVGAVPGYDPPVEADPGFDPEAARALLADAGYDDGSALGTLRLLFNTSSEHERVAVRLGNQWKELLGVEVATENYEWRVYLDRARSGRFSVARAGWFGDYPDPMTWLELMRGNNPTNSTGYDDPVYDGLLDQAAAETDPEKRIALLRQAEQKLLDDHVIIPLYQYVTVDLVAPDVRDLHQNAWNNMNLERAWVEADVTGTEN